MKPKSTTIALAVILFAMLSVVTIAVLVGFGKDPTIVVTFILAVIPVTVGVVVVSGQVESNSIQTDKQTDILLDHSDKIDGVAHAVNGKLDARFSSLEAAVEKVTNAVDKLSGIHLALSGVLVPETPADISPVIDPDTAPPLAAPPEG